MNSSNKIIQEDIQTIICKDFVDWKRLYGKTILITGANGFLPAYLVYTLWGLNDKFDAGIKILALVRNREKAANRFGDISARKDTELIVQDVCEPVDIEGNIDFIIHAASQASPKFYGSDPVGTINANVLGTLNLLKLAKIKNVGNFLYFSSGEIYGVVPDDITYISEIEAGYLDPVNVRSCYAESKRIGETMCVSWKHQFNIPVNMVRIFHSYGPGMELHDGRVFADFVSDIVDNRDIVMKSDGSAIRAFCYLTDATTAFFLILLHGKNGEAYNMGNPNGEISVIDLADMLIDLFPERNLKLIRKVEEKIGYIKSPVHRIAPDIAKISSLGWTPEIPVRDGFSRTINSYLLEKGINSI
jgi:UDP-glucuronate decarboxylase